MGFQPYRLTFESGYYHAAKRDANGYHSQFDFAVSKKNHLIKLNLSTGLGTRLGPSPESRNLGEIIIEEIFFPFRYGIASGQYGYAMDLSNKVLLEPYIGGGVLFANDSSYLVIPVSVKVIYTLDAPIDLGISGNYQINALNDFYTVSAVVGYRF
ncbi:hypothetical protein NMS_1976 [Nonlabens marinus S1-08]|uniref:Uncharacterized protein n=2 Tax=Nonlabens TaxID=363408 RepID=W8VS34_9FLAO|nr:hypothetical protein NMS_1976 [Nonlabens marinus S1-08]